ncbi:hypothetical protein I5Q31_05590 [Serratia marcescens]|nr:hypothetical protein [Serratia marcescens]MBH2766641.1 hypothetical protein [Serratia marcescens]MBH2766701.1 hypothetical protein [Serratia marcescens]
MNTKQLKLALLASLMALGAMANEVHAASVTSGAPATADVVVAASTITSHTLTAAQSSIAAGLQSSSITAANGEVKAGATDELTIKWDESSCALDTGSALICSVSGKTTPATNKAKFSLHAAGGNAALTAVPGVAPTWYSNGTQADFKYVVTLDSGQTVNADTYTLLVDAGVVTQ